MNVDKYIDKFSEIKQLPQQEQKKLLEKARTDAFTKCNAGSKFVAKSVVAVLAIFFIQMIFTYILVYQYDLNMVFGALLIGPSVLCINYVVAIFHKKLIHDAIKNDLTKKNAPWL